MIRVTMLTYAVDTKLTLWTVLVLLLSSCCHLAISAVDNKEKEAPSTIRIGLLYEVDHIDVSRAFKYAVNKVNERYGFNLIYDILQVPAYDSFNTHRKVCRQMSMGVAAIFGPMSSPSASHVQTVSTRLDVPHIEARLDCRDEAAKAHDRIAINVFPHCQTLNRALADLLDQWQWDQVPMAILYESNDGLVRLEELLNSDKYFNHISVYKLNATNGNYRSVLKQVRAQNIHHIVLDCDTRKVNIVLQQALTVQMVSSKYNYILTTLDSHLIDLRQFSYSGANITAFRLIDPERPQVIDIKTDWTRMHEAQEDSPLDSNAGIKTETALMYDAVQVFAKMLSELLQAQRIETASLNCALAQPWGTGLSLLNYLKLTEIDGLTGRITLDEHGERTFFDLDIVQLEEHGFMPIGKWNKKTKVNITKTYEEELLDVKNQTWRVTTLNSKPYAFLNNEGKLVGYALDLLEKIHQLTEIKYTVHLVHDGNYGSNGSGKWNGMVGEIIDGKADMAVADLTITSERADVVDFTREFMQTGISLLYQRPKRATPELFSFLSPLSNDVWFYMLAIYAMVSVILFVLARFTPYEWVRPHPCQGEDNIRENQFTFLNSFWFTMASLMQQGSEIQPRAVSTRMISCVWWFFTLILFSSYTANLAAFLTVERMTNDITNVDDLVGQSKIKYGAVASGSTFNFFRRAHADNVNGDKRYQQMYRYMEANRGDVLVSSNQEGIRRVINGGYVFLMESTSIDYAVERTCELTQVGGTLDRKGYGIALKKGNGEHRKLRDELSKAILKLEEDNVLNTLYTRWWKQEDGANDCKDNKKSDANALEITNVGGVFVMLVGGLIISLLVGVIEFFFHAFRHPNKDKNVCATMMDDLLFACRCCGADKKEKHRHKEEGEASEVKDSLQFAAPPYAE